MLSPAADVLQEVLEKLSDRVVPSPTGANQKGAGRVTLLHGDCVV